jgi:photosystem II stability/assembly factor-like uncharacterized protein
MKKLTSILFIIHCSALFVNAQWVQQTNGVTTPLYNIQFVNLNTGWVTGSNSVILKTTNSGVNWVQQPVALSGAKNLYGLSMLDANTGYAAGWFETIVKTTNGGTNWIIISDGPTGQGNSNNSASFINAQTGWVCSFLGRVLRTTDGGLSWDTANVGNTGPLEDIQFVNNLTGWVCGDGGNLRKTTNGGINWFGFPLLTTANLDGLYFLDVNTGWTVGEQDNMVFKTTNAGAKWDTMAILPGGNLQYSFSIYFSSALTGWIGGAFSRIFKTTDGGFNWNRENITVSAFFGNFSFYNDSIGWAAGGGGTIIHTTTSGEPLGITQINNEIPKEFRLRQNYPNPFNNSTNIEFDISENGIYMIELFNILGQKVNEFFNEYKTRGKYRVNYNAENLSSGTYFYVLSSSKSRDTKKFVLLK